jgi:hypothetical protein
MSKNTSLESDLLWFLEKFKGCENWISARDISRKGYVSKAGQEKVNSQHFRDLMKLAVAEEKAKPNLYPSTNKKYKICLINSKPKDGFFDHVILSHPLIIDLPPRKYLKMDLTINQHRHWNDVKSMWIIIYKAFCRHQNGRGVEDLSKEWNSDFLASREGIESSKRISLKVYFFIHTYNLLKLGWQEIEEECPAIFLQFSTYNDAFLKLLCANSRVSFEQCFRDISYRPRSMYEYLRENLHESGPALEAEAALKAEAVSKEIRQQNHERSQRLERLSGAPAEGTADAILFDLAFGGWIEEALKNSTNPDVREALQVWKEAEVAISKNTLSELNYERNLPKII